MIVWSCFVSLSLCLFVFLSCRFMVKRAMKTLPPGSSVLERVLDARQLAIKLLANVTYGYTAASFSGRMPMAELADAIVSSGRGMLEWAIAVVRSANDQGSKPNELGWGPLDVLYGDTDSLFVQLKGRSVEEAFRIGREIAYYITKKSPKHVVLKFEKVYSPCILVTKKRYVGRMFESEKQTTGELDCKG